MLLVKQELTPTYEDLIIDQEYYFAFGVDSIDAIQNDINAISEYAANSKRDMAELIDTDILAYARKNVKWSNMIGTNYSSGTVSIAVTTGVVTGFGSPVFTANMVGGILKVAGQTKGYYVSAYSSETSITVVDQGGTTYTGAAFVDNTSGTGTYVIHGATSVAVTKSTIYSKLVDLSTAMSASLCPREGRFIVVNAATEGILRQAPEFIPAVQSAYNGVVEKGLIGSIAGFKVFFSELLSVDVTTTGSYIFAGTKEFLSFATQIMKVSVVPEGSDPNSFITTCKGLLVWGRKVFDGNRAKGGAIRIVPTAS